MTKQIISWWKRFSFWDRIRLLLGSIGVGSEITLYFADSFPVWKGIAGVATIVAIAITYLFKDINKNNIIDIFEKK